MQIPFNSFYAFDPFTRVCPLLTFPGQRGETCVNLWVNWDEFLILANRLGPVLTGMRLGAFTSVTRCPGFDFQPVPDSSEVVDIVSGWVFDAAEVYSVVAVRESQPRPYLGIQCFDAAGQGLFKWILTEESCLTSFAEMLDGYAVANPFSVDTSNHGMDFCPPLPPLAQKLSPFLVIKSLLLAHQYRFPLSFTLHTKSQHRTVSVQVSRLERQGEDFLICDAITEIHLAALTTQQPWRAQASLSAQSQSALFLPMEKAGLLEINYAGSREQIAPWEALHAACGAQEEASQ